MPWYTWVFDGIGGAIVVACIGFVVRKLFFKPNNNSHLVVVDSSIHSPTSVAISAPVSDASLAIGNNISQQLSVHHHYGLSDPEQELGASQPTPLQIVDDLVSMSPFDRLHANQKYLQLKVVWPVTLQSLSATYGAKSWLVLTFFGKGFPIVLVSFEVTSLSAEIRSAPKGSLLWISGSIKTVKEVGIDLEKDPIILKMERLRDN